MIPKICVLALVFCVALGDEQDNYYDFRVAHPSCVNKAIGIYKNCPSSWAFAFAGVMSDRLCVKNKGVYVKLSAQDLLCKAEARCKGSFSITDLFAASKSGVTDDTCIPYEDNDAHCPTATCKNGTDPVVHTCKVVRSISEVIEKEEDIKRELREKGPVMCEFAETVDHDDYYDGVYYRAHFRKKNAYLTAYKVVGYGMENGMKYWIGEQSKGCEFGEDGYVRYRISHELCSKIYICDEIE